MSPSSTSSPPSDGDAAAQLTFDDAVPAEAKALTVSALVRWASQRLESHFSDVWVAGEVSNLRTPASGHCYFTLKDAKAQLSVVMFRTSVGRLGFRLQDGQELRCRGRLGIYDAQGRFQLTATTADPVGAGALQLAFEQLKRRLQAEGLFDSRHKKPLPGVPRTIGVVTSRTGAALRDILRVLHRRFPVRVLVCPTAVQGADAPAEIVAALKRADAAGVDLIIAGRGGGSLEDLYAFNHESVARAIFEARTPVISSVGHEVDVTIADMVADKRAPTPSAAAELAVPEMRELIEQLRVCQLRLGKAAASGLRTQRLAWERLQNRLGSPGRRVDRARMTLDEATSKLQSRGAGVVTRRREKLYALKSRLATHEPRARLARHRGLLQQQSRELSVVLQQRLARRRARLEQLLGRLELLSPLSVLERGYGFVLDESGALIRQAAGMSVGQCVKVRLADGEVTCRVEELNLLLQASPTGKNTKTVQ